MKITPKQLKDVCLETSEETLQYFVEPLNNVFAEHAWQINTPARVAAFLAQAAHESNRFRSMVENLNYSADGLLRVFGKYFTAQEALDYARQPERIANRVYAGRMGNGDETSGDGWRFRGRGIFHHTGRGEYRTRSQRVYADPETLLVCPELVEDPDCACLCAGDYWHENNLNALADRGQFEQLTRRINGGTNGLQDRVALWKRAEAALM